jgi:sortase A
VTSVGVALPAASPAAKPGAKSAATDAPALTVAAAVLQWAAIALAGLALWLGLFGIGLSGLQEQHAQHDLYAGFRADLAAGTASLGGAITEGTPVALLQSSAAGFRSLVVVEGTASTDLRSGPGHYPGTVLPGQAGASLLLGRSVSYGAPFARITRLRPGDGIDVTTGQGRFRYRVVGIRRAGDPNPKPLAAGGSQLTLVTSEGTGWRSGWAPSRAVFVDPLLKGKSVAAPATIGVPTAADRPMHGTTGSLYPLVLWLQLLVLGAVGIVIGRARWGTWQSWLIGLPVVLAALWGASNSAWVLLPNLV